MDYSYYHPGEIMHSNNFLGYGGGQGGGQGGYGQQGGYSGGGGQGQGGYQNQQGGGY
jgi:hypothetical protein